MQEHQHVDYVLQLPVGTVTREHVAVPRAEEIDHEYDQRAPHQKRAGATRQAKHAEKIGRHQREDRRHPKGNRRQGVLRTHGIEDRGQRGQRGSHDREQVLEVHCVITA